ncbi:MAG: polysaccharide biosynthesis tyrosine autokinase [Bacteroidota bacterium]
MNNNGFDSLRDSETHTLKDYINLIKLNIIPIVLITLTGLIVASIYAYNAQDIYKSTTVIKLAKPSGSILNSPLMPEFNDWGSDRFIANEMEILKSYRIREIVTQTLIDSFSSITETDSFYLILNREVDYLNKSPKPLLKSSSDIIGLLANVSIDQKRGLDIVEISMESPSPFEAALIANCYADSYAKLNLQYERQQLIIVKKFLSEQKNEKYQSLITAEENLKKFQEKGGIILIEDQAKSLIDVLTDFESQRDGKIIELSIANQTLKELKAEIQRKNPSISEYVQKFSTEPRLESLQKSISELQARIDYAQANTDENFSNKAIVRDSEIRLAELNKKLDEQVAIYKTNIFAATPEELKELSLSLFENEVKAKSIQSSIEQLNEIVKKYEQKFSELPDRTLDYARYKRELSAFEKLYLIVEEKYQESLIIEQSTPGNVLIIDVARRPLEPSKPNRNLIVLVGLILGMGMGFGFAFVRNYFDTTVKTPEEIQNKNINVLAWVPKIDLLETNKDLEFIVAKKPDSIHSEAFRALRTRIQFSKLGDESIRSILVTSSTPREGKTMVSANIAGSFAQANKKVCIIDCDLRKPRMHSLFNANRYPGFTDYFFEQVSFDEIVRKSEVANLDYITVGTIPPNPSEILSSKQMEGLFAKLKEIYDIVVVDSPPIIAVTDSEILSRLLDATILVVSANETEMELMEKAVELLTHEKKSFIGVLLNNFSYRSGYGSYYKYYYYYSHDAAGKSDKQKSKTSFKS